MGCVSISTIETQYKTFESSNAISSDSEVDIKFVAMAPEFCITEDQKYFLNSIVKKYFFTSSTDRATVTVRQNFSNNLVVGILNAVLVVSTFTVVPMYYDTSFDFLITVDRGAGHSENFYAFVNDRGLGSILAIPFMFTRSLSSVRRNNIENAFYLSSMQGTSRNEVLSKVETYTPKLCPTFTDSKFKF